MPIINQIITRLESSKAGSAINRVLRTGTYLEVTKENAKNTYKVVRKREQGDVYTTIVKKVKDKFVTKSVVEEHRFGIISIKFRNDGSIVFNLRPCNVRGRGGQNKITAFLRQV